jgi:hypothetical protein
MKGAEQTQPCLRCACGQVMKHSTQNGRPVALQVFPLYITPVSFYWPQDAARGRCKVSGWLLLSYVTWISLAGPPCSGCLVFA